jgi:RNA polymerase primary sigma factor
LSLVLREEDDRLRGLINRGKERGYVLFDEVNEVLPGETPTDAELDGLFSAFEGHNIPIFDDVPVTAPGRGLPGVAERVESEMGEDPVRAEELELHETASLLDTTSDPVRLYLREMGSVRPLKGEEEVALAKRLERGQALVLKTVSRSPVVLEELIEIGRGVAQRQAFD